MKYWLWLAGLVSVVIWFLMVERPVLEQLNDNSKNVRVSEIMVSGIDGYVEILGGDYDFIEVHNFGNLKINLEGYGLSDDPKEPFKYTFPNVELDSDAYIVLTATTDKLANNFMNVGFAIKSGEEGVYLTHPEEDLLSKVVPNNEKDRMSYGYHEGTQRYQWLLSPTPGSENAILFVEDSDVNLSVDIPKISYGTGAYSSNPLIEMMAKEGQEIFYTLDGSVPTEESFKYQGSFELSVDMNTNDFAGYEEISYMTPKGSTWGRPRDDVYKAAIIRMVAYEPGVGLSEVSTHTYFIDPEFADRYTLPIVSIVVESDGFFSDETGIYVLGDAFQDRGNPNVQGDAPANYNQRGKDWEREAHFSYLNSAGELLHQQTLGVRTHGAWSRANPHKGLRFFAREEYGAEYLDYPLFEGLTQHNAEEPIDEFKQFLLRASGNDWSFTLFRDAMMQEVSVNVPFEHEIDHQAYQPTVVFLNGEYWGIHNLRETVDPDKLASHYGIDPELITIAEGDIASSRSKLDVGNEEVAEGYNQMIDELRELDLSQDANYEMFVAQVDVENFAQYMIAQTFLGNTDWPGNNIRYWKMNEADDTGLYGHDGRWRYILYDTDFGFHIYEGMQNNVEFDSIEFASTEYGEFWPNPEWSTVLFRKALENKQFQHYFLNAYASMLNTSYRHDHLLKVIARYRDGIMAEINEHNDRYGTIDAWHYEVGRLESFASRRGHVMWEHLQNHFETGDLVNLTVSTNMAEAGSVYFDSFDVTKWSNPYSGRYFTAIPINLRIEAEDGYEVIEIKGLESQDLKQVIIPAEATQIEVIFGQK